MVKAHPVVRSTDNTDRFEHAEHPRAAHVRRELRLAEGKLDEADGAEVVDLVRLNLFDRCNEGGQIGEIAVDQLDLGYLVLDDARFGIVLSPDHSVNLIALSDEQFGQVATILTGDPRNEGTWHGSSL